MNRIQRLPRALMANRRCEVLAGHVADLVPTDASVLDVGCGDGALTRRIGERRPDLRVEGIEVFVRPDAEPLVREYDGQRIPYSDDAFETVLLIDVLHHARDPMSLLREAVRVARRNIVLKDHVLAGLLAHATLRFMDRAGNPPEVDQPHNYWVRQRWLEVFREVDLLLVDWRGSLGIYPLPADWVFGRSLHFVALLDVVR